MTSGQGEQEPGGQQGPPTGPGEPVRPGYAPAPSVQLGQGAPPAVERPDTVRFGIGAFVAGLLVSLISTAVTLTDFERFVDRAVAAAQEAGTEGLTEELIRRFIEIGLVFGLLMVVLEVMFIAFAWRGRHWARVVLWALGGIDVVFGLAGSSGDSGQTGFTASMGWFQLLFTAAGIVLLAMTPSNDWYRYRRWQRATGQA
jgi:hypothetical protein